MEPYDTIRAAHAARRREEETLRQQHTQAYEALLVARRILKQAEDDERAARDAVIDAMARREELESLEVSLRLTARAAADAVEVSGEAV